MTYDPLAVGLPARRRYGPRPLAGSIFDRPHHRSMRTMNPIPFGAPEDAYDTSMDNYLTECACCHEQAMRDDLDEYRFCDSCIEGAAKMVGICARYDVSAPDPAEDRREAIADAAYHDAKGV